MARISSLPEHAHLGDWETAHTVPDQPQFVLDFARQWQAAEKIVYSRTLAEPRSARTKIERSFDPDGVRKLKANAASDIAVAGPELAAQAIQAGMPTSSKCVSRVVKRLVAARIRLKKADFSF